MATFRIAKSRWSQFNSTLDNLNAKASAYGCEPFSLTITGEGSHTTTRGATTVEVEFYEVELTGEPVKRGPYLVAARMHRRGEGIDVRMYKEGLPIPAAFLDEMGRCEHCESARTRTKTFIVVHTGDERMYQVGSSCLKDFTGIELSTAAAGSRLLAEIHRLLKAEEVASEQFRYGKLVYQRFPLREFLARVAQVLRGREVFAGKPLAPNGFDGWLGFEARRLSQIADAPLPSEDEVSLADQALKSLKQDVDVPEFESEGLANASLLLQAGELESWQASLAAWVVRRYVAHQKLLERELEHKKLMTSWYVGTLKKRELFKVTVNRVVYLGETPWGVMYLVHFLDSVGNVLVWKTSSVPSALDEGWAGTIKATVKAHELYKGVKQTHLSRVAVMEEKPAASVGAETPSTEPFEGHEPPTLARVA